MNCIYPRWQVTLYRFVPSWILRTIHVCRSLKDSMAYPDTTIWVHSCNTVVLCKFCLFLPEKKCDIQQHECRSSYTVRLKYGYYPETVKFPKFWTVCFHVQKKGWFPDSIFIYTTASFYSNFSGVLNIRYSHVGLKNISINFHIKWYSSHLE